MFRKITQYCFGLVQQSIRNYAQVSSSGSQCTGESIRMKFSQANVDPNREAIPNDDGRKPIRFDDLAILKNHHTPHQKNYCEPLIVPAQLWRYVPENRDIDLGPRRPRKTVTINKACPEDCGKPTATGCTPINCKGCQAARRPTRCFDIRAPDNCKPVPTPTLSFHHCVREDPDELPPDQCKCHADQAPPCNPTKRKTFADR